jgi:hypothetical protein
MQYFFVLFYFKYFYRRHVSKSQRLEGTELNSLQWLFHPLARKFLAEPKRVAEILGGTGAQRIPNFPFSGSPQSRSLLHCLNILEKYGQQPNLAPGFCRNVCWLKSANKNPACRMV